MRAEQPLALGKGRSIEMSPVMLCVLRKEVVLYVHRPFCEASAKREDVIENVIGERERARVR